MVVLPSIGDALTMKSNCRKHPLGGVTTAKQVTATAVVARMLRKRQKDLQAFKTMASSNETAPSRSDFAELKKFSHRRFGWQPTSKKIKCSMPRPSASPHPRNHRRHLLNLPGTSFYNLRKLPVFCLARHSNSPPTFHANYCARHA